MNTRVEHEHIHSERSNDLDEYCRCGAKICMSNSPSKAVGCTLTEGHDGPHKNQWCPEYGSWEQPNHEEMSEMILSSKTILLIQDIPENEIIEGIETNFGEIVLGKYI